MIMALMSGTSLKALTRLYSTCPKLEEIGKFEAPVSNGLYQAGQLFLHRVFGYRGLIIDPWMSINYDERAENGDRNFEPAPFYQAVIDQRDLPHIRVKMNTEMGKEKINGPIKVVDDLVQHDDIIPYTSSEVRPIKNELAEDFLKHHRNLGLHVRLKSDISLLRTYPVYKQSTEQVRVTVSPHFMGSKLINKKRSYWWRIWVRLESLRDEPVKIIQHHWGLLNKSGEFDVIKGPGLHGEDSDVVLSPSQPAFQYCSYITRESSCGQMWGSYKIENTNGSIFHALIPEYPLKINVA